jgi:4-amino-4-deoxy-L-arabinose transferase-like glycosyltransferase
VSETIKCSRRRLPALTVGRTLTKLRCSPDGQRGLAWRYLVQIRAHGKPGGLHKGASSNLREEFSPSRALVAGVFVLVAAGTLAGVFGGPRMGEHGTIVALCARNMRLSGDWIVPDFMGTPWIRKPPLPYWLVAAVSYLFPNDSLTHLPVTTAAARLPSGVTALVTVLLLWRLGTSMFGRRTGIVTAVLAGSSLLFLICSVYATAEMPLTCCCTWAFFHFWYAVTSRQRRSRILHLLLFYIAMGFAMLAKAPAPLALVAMPLAVWWYTERPLRLLARCGPGAWRQVLLLFIRQLWPRTIQVFTRLWLAPGLVVCGLLFVPWILKVAHQYPHAWDLWNWQYWQRVQGNYGEPREGGPHNFLWVVAGLLLPWVFMIVEALAAPWMARYARQRRALLYAGLWAVVGIAVMSTMEFKKAYYVAPSVPGLLLLMAVVGDRFYSRKLRRDPVTLRIGLGARRRAVTLSNPVRLAWGLWGIAAVASVVGLVAGSMWFRQEMPKVSMRMTFIAAGTLVLFLIAGAAYVRGRGWAALGITAVTTIAAFNVVWYWCEAAIEEMDNLDKVAGLATALDAAGVPPDAKVLYMDGSPQSRLTFYFNRRNGFLVTPEEIVARMVDRVHNKRQLQELIVNRADELLGSREPVYLVLDQKNYEQYEPHMPRQGKVIATVEDPDSPGRSTVVVSNVARPTSQRASP